MKRMFLYLLIGISINSNAQVIENSLFSLTQVAGTYSKVRANSATDIVSTSYSIRNKVEMFTFIKDSNTMIYATVPYGYRINDFVILDDCIFFCGRNFVDSCGYICIFDVNVSTMNIGGYRFINIYETNELTEMIAYKVSESLPRYDVMAIGKTKDYRFPTCVIDLNNYYWDDYWRCGIGYELDSYFTDIALMWDGNSGEIVTVGQSLVSNTNSLMPYVPKMYIRNYKKNGGFVSGMDDVLNIYTNIKMSPTSPFKATRLSDNNVAISSMISSRDLLSNGIEIKRIDLNSMIINNIQLIRTSDETLKELTYFPASSKLAILAENTQHLSKIFFANYTQDGTYYAQKIYNDDLLLNSISSYDNNHFLSTGVGSDLINSPLFLLQANLNNFSTNECVINESVQASSENKSIYPNDSYIEPLAKYDCTVEYEEGFPEIYETTININCINYYK